MRRLAFPMRLLALLPLLLATSLAMAAPPGVTATPARVVLGKDAEVVLEVRVSEEAGPVRAAASSGAFTRDSVAEGAVRTFHWKPPDVRYPLEAVLLFWMEGPEGQPPEVARVRLPLLGRTTLDITTNPGAQVVVEIADARFGPVRANARGQASVPVEVPPGEKRARVLATSGSLRTDRMTPLAVPPHQPLVAMLSPSPMPSTGGWLVVAGAEDVAPADLDVSVEGARVEPVGGAPATFRVRPVADASLVSVQVRRKKGPDSARTSVTVLPSPAQPVPPPEEPPSPPGVAEAGGNLGFHVLAGGFFAEGANTGLAAALGASYRLPVLRGRLAAELEVGARQASLEAVDSFGVTRSSRVLAGPVLASARFTALQWRTFSLYARVGAGVIPFEHRMTSDFQDEVRESKVEPMAFLSAQGALRLGSVSALVELRGAYGSVRTPWIDAQLGGVAVMLGMRYAP